MSISINLIQNNKNIIEKIEFKSPLVKNNYYNTNSIMAKITLKGSLESEQKFYFNSKDNTRDFFYLSFTLSPSYNGDYIPCNLVSYVRSDSITI